MDDNHKRDTKQDEYQGTKEVIEQIHIENKENELQLVDQLGTTKSGGVMKEPNRFCNNF
jgi:hypothetical protein